MNTEKLRKGRTKMKFFRKNNKKESYKKYRVTHRDWDTKEVFIEVVDERTMFWMNLYQDTEILKVEKI